MSNLYKKIASFILLIFMVPAIAFASWWNPFSWFKSMDNFLGVRQEKNITKKPAPTSAGNTTTTSTVLKDFNSDGYGISFKYPSNWNLLEVKDAGGIFQALFTFKTNGGVPVSIGMAGTRGLALKTTVSAIEKQYENYPVSPKPIIRKMNIGGETGLGIARGSCTPIVTHDCKIVIEYFSDGALSRGLVFQLNATLSLDDYGKLKDNYYSVLNDRDSDDLKVFLASLKFTK